jgi:hypothetical protein
MKLNYSWFMSYREIVNGLGYFLLKIKIIVLSDNDINYKKQD